MRIQNVNNGGYATPQPVPGAGQVANPTATGQAISQAGNALQQAGNDMLRIDLYQAQQEKQEREELARAKTANASLDHELYVSEVADDIASNVANGSIPYEKAETEFQTRLTKAPVFTPVGDRALMETYDRTIKRTNFKAGNVVNKAAKNAMQADYKGQFGIALDKLGKLAGLPGADVQNINERAGALLPLAKRAGMDDAAIAKVHQDFKDNNWFNQGSQAVLGAGDDMIALKALQHELTADDGYYADKLDPQKRTALMKTLDSQMDRITNREIHAADKREAKAERVLTEIDKQVASTVPATPAQWDGWAEQVKGTAFEQDFKDRVDDEQEVQTLLRKPIEDQMSYLQSKQQSLATNGGDLRTQANVKRLESAVNSNVKLLKENPLIFNQNRTGQEVEPIDVTAIASGGEVASQLKDRFVTVQALRKRYGQEVALNPLLPQEAEAIKAVVSKADDSTKLAVLGVLAQVSPDATAYASVLKAVAPDSGMLMVAGMAKFKNLKSTSGRDLAGSILQGEKILADKSVIMPTEAAFKVAFEDEIGNAIPDGSPQRATAFAVFKTLYASMANDQEVRHTLEDKNMADTNLARQAIALSTGGVVKYNGSKVIIPYGMKQDDFTRKIDAGLTTAAEASGYSKDVLEDMPLMKVPGVADSYYLLSGSKIQAGKDGKPIMIKVGDGAVVGKIKKAVNK